MNKKNYDVDYFISKFSKIKENEIGRGQLFNHCSYWHCGVRFYEKPTAEAIALSDLLHPLQPKSRLASSKLTWAVININDGNNTAYQQPTPKQRILAALKDIKAKEQQFIPHPPIQLNPNKSKIRYVVLTGMEEKELVTEN